MRIRVIFFFLFLISTNAFACVCNIKPEFETQSDLKEYDFIAHIKVSKIDKVDGIDPTVKIHQMSFEILELFKGNQLDDILVYGSNPLLNGRTSCGLGEIIGDEWIIFGYKNLDYNKQITGYCTRSKKIKSFNGYEDIKYANQETLAKKLQKIFNIKFQIKEYEEERIEYFQNGNKQLIEIYKNGKIDGQRKIWYPNSILQSDQFYKNGDRNGTFKWYSDKANLTKLEHFKNDIPIDTTKIWREIDTTYLSVKIYSDLNNVDENDAKKSLSERQIWIERVYNEKGQIVSSLFYGQSGNIEKKTIYFPEKNEYTIRNFYDNEVLQEEVNYKNNINHGFYQYWNENGKLKKSWYYDENGNVDKKTVIKY